MRSHTTRLLRAVTVLVACAAGAALAMLVGSASGAVSEQPFFRSSGDVVFNFVPVGTTSEEKTVTISNAGGGILELEGVEIAKYSLKEFSIVSNDCDGVSLGTGQTCAIAVVFHPTSEGTKLGSLIVTDTRETCGIDYVALAGSGTVAASPTTSTDTAHAADCLVPGQTVTVQRTVSHTVVAHQPTVRVTTQAPACKSARTVAIHLGWRKLGPVVQANVYVDGRLEEVRRGRSLTRIKVSLKGRPRGRYKVYVVGINAHQQRMHSVHYYVTCVPGN